MNACLRNAARLAVGSLAMILAACAVGPVDSTADEDVGAARDAVVTGTVYRMRPQSSAKCVDIEGSSPYDGASAIQWDCWATSNQYFTATVQTDGSWTFAAQNSGKCLTVVGTEDGAGVEQLTCSGYTSQRFTLGYMSDGTYLLQPLYPSGKCVEVPGFSLANGTALDVWGCNAGSNQRFYIEAVP